MSMRSLIQNDHFENDNWIFTPLDIQCVVYNWLYHLKAQFLEQNNLQISELSLSCMVQNQSSWCTTDIPYHQSYPSLPVQYTSSLWFPRLTNPFDHLILPCTNLYLNYFQQFLNNVQ